MEISFRSYVFYKMLIAPNAIIGRFIYDERGNDLGLTHNLLLIFWSVITFTLGKLNDAYQPHIKRNNLTSSILPNWGRSLLQPHTESGRELQDLLYMNSSAVE